MLSLRKWANALLGRFLDSPRKNIGPTSTSGNRSSAEIQRWIQDNIAEILNVASNSLDPTEPFTSYGLDSIAGFTLTLDLADWLERDLPASLFWEYQTIAELAQYLGKEE